MPHYLQVRSRINLLLDRYMNLTVLNHQLMDLPSQFETPHTRHWEPIEWKAIHPDQIVGIDPDVFCDMIASVVEIESPIQDYARESQGYFQPVDDRMAGFVGGVFDEAGALKTMGTWGKEERQHAPAFRKIYECLTGEKLDRVKANSVQGYVPGDDATTDLRSHVQSRITTEWSAASVYIWLMAHSTGALQNAIAQPLQDEVNHLAKFWGFSRWVFEDSFLDQFQGSTQELISLFKHHGQERSTAETLSSQTQQLSNLPFAIELSFTFLRVMVRLRDWNRQLSQPYLQYLFTAKS